MRSADLATIDRRAFVSGLVLGALASPLTAEAQLAGKVYRIGVLGWSPGSFYEDQGYLKAFREELHRLGWVEGRNLRIEYRFADGQADRLLPLLTELDGLALDLIVTITTTVAKAAAKAIKTTPIVFTVVADPVESGIVSSLARPSGNATGPAALVGPEATEKWLELLKEAVPKISRVAVLWEPTNPGGALTFQRMRDAAPTFGLMVQSLEVRRPDDLSAAFAAMVRKRPDALVALTTPLTVRYRDQVIEFAPKNKLPSMGLDFPQAGVSCRTGSS